MACIQCYLTDFKNSNTKYTYKTNGIFPNSINEIVGVYMFELGLNTNLRRLWCVFLLVRVTYVTFFYEIAYYDFIDYILE